MSINDAKLSDVSNLQIIQMGWLLSLKSEQVPHVYSGRAGRCCCGCSGKHRYHSKHIAAENARRGYNIDAEEVNDRQVARVLAILQERVREAVFGNNNVSVTVDERLYVVYVEGVDRIGR